MQCSAHTLPYAQTNSFSRIVLDYLSGAPELRPFYGPTPDANGLAQALDRKAQHPVNRAALVEALQQQYAWVPGADAVQQNIAHLLLPNTFTVCTAHQPNLFTGPLYFLYKILHAIKLAAELNTLHPDQHFVPVYYMGSEDADLEELNHFTVQGKRYTWTTDQQGAVGRMQVDAALEALLTELQGQLSAFPFGEEVWAMLRKNFKKGATIQQATFGLVHELFSSFGLVVLIPDYAGLKGMMRPLFEQELFAPVSSSLVEETSAALGEHYNVQAHPREINLFYLEGNIRQRILRTDEGFAVHNTALKFTDAEMRTLLDVHPERFSPNVILRGLFQETILPNIAFIGGGGELAYWLQLKALFDHYSIPFPVLILRNSFMLLEQKWQERIAKLELTVDDCFESTGALMNRLVLRLATHPLKLNGKMEQADALFEAIREQATIIDPTLSQHVAALKKTSLNKLEELEKKMLRAEKRRHSDSQRQIEAVRNHLFPGNGLQERVDSFLYYYALVGPQLIQELYRYSGTCAQQFTVLMMNPEDQGAA